MSGHRSSRQDRARGKRALGNKTRSNVAKMLFDHCKRLGVDPPTEVTQQLAVGRMATHLGELFNRLNVIVSEFDQDGFVTTMLQFCNDPDELAQMMREDGLLALMESAIVIAGLAQDDQESPF